MKQRTLLYHFMLLVCLLVLGAGSAWGDVSTLTFTAACGGTGTANDNASWTITSDASESTYDNTKGIHYGTGSAAVSHLTLSTSGIRGTITKIVVNASGASQTSAKLNVKVNNSAFDSEKSLTSSAANYTFEGSASGNIEVKLTQTSAKKALYVKSIAVTYTPAQNASFSFANSTPAVLLEGGEANYVQAVTVTPNTYDGTITYSYKGGSIAANDVEINSSTGAVYTLETGTVIVAANGTATYKYNKPTEATYTLTISEAAAYNITPIANNNSYGSVSIVGSTITAIPNAGYKVPTTGGYTVTEGTATVTNNGDGTFTVTPTSDCTVQIDFVAKATPSFSFASATASATYGGTVTPPALTNDESTGAVTYESSNTKVATIDENTGEVTPVSVGTTTITANVAEDDNYKTAQASYILTVNEDETASGAKNTEILFSESFSKLNSTGGRDNYYESTAGSGTLTASNCDYTSWVVGDYLGAAKSCIKVGTSNNNGSLTSGNINLTGGGVLSFAAAGWNSGTNTATITATGCTLSSTSQTVTNSTWNTYNINVTNATGTITIKFGGKRYFLDDIVLSQTLDTYCVSATIPASTWGTYCSPYALDFSNAATTVTAYAVSDYDAAAATITFTKITGKVPAKTPIVITGTAGAQKIAVAEGETSAPATNLLRGYLSPAYYAGADASETLMGLSGGTFKKMQAGTIPANKAVLVMDTDDFNDIPDGDSSKMTFIFEEESETDGITSHNVNFVKYDGNVYNLAGQRVGNDYKGIIIENGKKVVRK